MGTHPIFESDFDCLTELEMLSRLCVRSACLSTGRRTLSTTSAFPAKEGVRSAQGQVDDWLNRNAKTSRPMSPHLGIYTWSIPMAFSAANRILSVALVGAFFLGIAAIDLLGSGDVVADMESFSSSMRESTLGTVGVTSIKFGLFFPFFYHTFVGFRHWSWDIFAVGIRNMGTFMTTGWVALGAALVFGLAFTLFHSPEWVSRTWSKREND